MERRFPVLAKHDSQALIRREWPRRAWMIALTVAVMAGAAEAKPKRRDAKAAYDRGVVAYQKGNLEAAVVALSKSFELERDPDTLFAWAQAERKLEHCDKAIELYERVLGFKLPGEAKIAVEQKLSECRTVIAMQKAAIEPPVVEPAVEPPSPPSKPPAAVAPPPIVERTPATEPPPAVAAGRAWYKDPVALALLGTGVVATGVGAGFLVSARSLDQDSKRAQNFFDVKSLSEQARSRGNIGLISGGVGGALVIGGVVWIVLHRGGTERPSVTGWLAPGGGGLAVAGGF